MSDYSRYSIAMRWQLLFVQLTVFCHLFYFNIRFEQPLSTLKCIKCLRPSTPRVWCCGAVCCCKKIVKIDSNTEWWCCERNIHHDNWSIFIKWMNSMLSFGFNFQFLLVQTVNAPQNTEFSFNCSRAWHSHTQNFNRIIAPHSK